MFKVFCLSFIISHLSFSPAGAQATSPNGLLTLETTNEGSGMTLCYQQKPLLCIPQVGIERGEEREESGARRVERGERQLKFVRTLQTDYQMLAGKRLRCTNKANEYVMELSEHVKMVVRLYNDGLAFRYELSGLAGERAPRELTT